MRAGEGGVGDDGELLCGLPGLLDSLTAAELQPDRHQRVAVGRAPHPRHATPGQAYLPLHARQRRDRVFQLPVC